MADLTIHVEIPAGLKDPAALFGEEITKGLADGGRIVETQAKQNAHVFTGNLRRSIISKVQPIGSNPGAIIAAQAHYAPYVEHGTRPHTPPFHPIARYASRHGILPGALWMTIRKFGTREHPFMRPAFDEKRQAVIDRVKRAVAETVRRMGT